MKFDRSIGSPHSFVRIFNARNSFDKSIDKTVDNAMTKAYYEEQRVLSKHIRAAHFIRKIIKPKKIINSKPKIPSNLEYIVQREHEVFSKIISIKITENELH